ncbi:MAG: Sec-independent protein translocase protein TatB [Proteobacteria bacterium]|nr:Sec-independent protein translocase protein TatB [Pseudomonadota bacterium]
MFGIGLPEFIVIMIVALLVVGPTKLPELAKSLGKALQEFRRMADEVKETIDEEILKEEPSKEEANKGELYLQKDAKTEEKTDINSAVQHTLQDEASMNKEKPITHHT